MFSGGDSSDDINSLNQLASYGFVNQVAVSNAMAAGQNIDWAQLAQQWIQMRDNSHLDAKMSCDASGSKVDNSMCNNLKFEEKGEADMDMDDEEQSNDKALQRSNTDLPPSVAHNINQSWFFGGSNSQIAPRPTNSNQWNPWPDRENLPKHNVATNRHTNPTAHIPSLLKINVPHPNEVRVMPDIPNHPDNTNTIDAAKRKRLPAWIREGLEKMEREKQKQLEKIQRNSDINSSDEENISNKNFVKSINSFNGVSPTALNDETIDNEEPITSTAKSQRDNNLKDNEEDDTYSSSEDKTYEQKLAELMTVVRRILTELLLEVTNEEISKVADETIKFIKSKASSAQVIRKSALSTLNDKLGLAAYGDSSSENDSDNDESNSSKKASDQSESNNDSEEEIRNAIRLKRRAFIKISEEIEERVASAAAREEEKLKYFLRKEEEEMEHNRGKQEASVVRDPSTPGHNIFKGYEKDFGEITETKIQHLNGKRQRERCSRRERITRFSDNKDKYVTVPNSATFLTNLSNASTFGSGNSATATATNTQWQNIPDINGLLPNYTSAGMTNALNAADAALEKALKAKTPTNDEKQSRRRDRDRTYNQPKKRRLSESKHSRSRSKSSCSSTSSSSSSSSDSDSSTSRSSHHSKYKRRSQKKYIAKKQYEKSHKDIKSERKYSSYSYKKRDRVSSSRGHRNASSDSEDEYCRRYRNDSNYIRKSSQTRSYSSSRRSRDREHSRSQSRSSYSSSNRRQ